MVRAKVKIFRAVDDQDSCKKFLEGHVNVLKVFGVTQVTTASNDWFFNPNVYVVLIESFEGEAWGGVRVHVAHEDYPLPMEDATRKIDPKMRDFIGKLRLNGGTGELCGLWNAREVGGMGIGTLFLMWAGISVVSSIIQISTLVALCAQHTFQICLEKGFEVVHEVGNKGTFYYPKDDLVATAVIIQDPKNLSKATELEKKLILELRQKPDQISVEDTPKGFLELNYQLTSKLWEERLTR